MTRQPRSDEVSPPPQARAHDRTLYAELRALSCGDRLRLNDRALQAALELRAAFDASRE